MMWKGFALIGLLSLFQHVKMRVLVQAQRFVVFSIIDNLVARHREGVLYASPSERQLTSEQL